MEKYLYESVKSLNGVSVVRLKSSIFYWGAVLSFLVGVIVVMNGNMWGLAIAGTIAPCLALYPLIRFIFGGKDSVAGVVATIVVEEVLKAQIQEAFKKDKNKKR
jgi:ABC-type branched-subunit amino acid transport system permease subunit